MSAITKERIELFIKNPLDNGLTRGEQMELARIALASLEADPVAYIFKHPAGKLFWALTDESNKEQADVIPVYAAPPVPVVPEEKPMPNPLKMYAVDAVAAIAEVRGWNACRAAMLQGKSEQPQNAQQNIPENFPDGNSPVIPDGLSTVCAEAYQVVGVMADALGVFGDAAVQKVLDNLSQQKLVHRDVLPFSLPVTPDGWISCSERMPVIGELNWRTSFPLLITCEIGVIPAYYGFVSVNGDRHYGFMESLKYGDDSGNHPQTNEYGLISNVTHWMPLPEPPQHDGE